MDEVNVHAIDRCHELRQGVEPGLGLSPVVVRRPVLDDLLEFGELRALRSVADRLPVGPARVGDATAEVDERLFRNMDLEGPDRRVVSGRNRLPGQDYNGE